MSNPDREAPSPLVTEVVGLPDARNRELLDYLIERAWQTLLRNLPHRPANETHDTKHAA